MMPQRQRDKLPELTPEQYFAVIEALSIWALEKADHEARWTDEQRAALRQLAPDLWHSALLRRMLLERKPPLPEPPPLLYSYPVYPDDDA